LTLYKLVSAFFYFKFITFDKKSEFCGHKWDRFLENWFSHFGGNELPPKRKKACFFNE